MSSMVGAWWVSHKVSRIENTVSRIESTVSEINGKATRIENTVNTIKDEQVKQTKILNDVNKEVGEVHARVKSIDDGVKRVETTQRSHTEGLAQLSTGQELILKKYGLLDFANTSLKQGQNDASVQLQAIRAEQTRQGTILESSVQTQNNINKLLETVAQNTQPAGASSNSGGVAGMFAQLFSSLQSTKSAAPSPA